ncbi:hypothetical protein [Argonema antarcticum]|uniref:hypothetical protein n=1 Tax=Argonema antarcticum TaxID=2942763 RepID=UPI002012A2C2|nr:hypothetical protein [Argonema antarcticum]MCL1474782.1 hypothetical protein [Argonema antarcticum A004/B2]
MPKLTRKKPRYRKSDRAINEPSTVKPITIETDEETATILAQIEAERDYYHTCTNSKC